VPAKNQPDLRELPSRLTEGLKIVPIKTIDEALRLAILRGNQEIPSLTEGESEDLEFEEPHWSAKVLVV
jgi:predicted ATP-dependent protease